MYQSRRNLKTELIFKTSQKHYYFREVFLLKIFSVFCIVFVALFPIIWYNRLDIMKMLGPFLCKKHNLYTFVCIIISRHCRNMQLFLDFYTFLRIIIIRRFLACPTVHTEGLEMKYMQTAKPMPQI